MMGTRLNPMAAMAVALAVVLLLSPVAVTGRREGEWEPEEEESRRMFVLGKSEQVVKTDGGEVRVVRGFQLRDQSHPMHIAFISMEPNTLFIPQYLDASLILFVRRGEAKIGWIHKDKMVEKQLKMGDVNRIPAGSAFYMVNTGKGQRLQIISAIDTSESLGSMPYQSFYIGGGIYPRSVLAGFDIRTLSTAFNVTTEDIQTLLGSHIAGPIVYMTGEAAEQPHRLFSILKKTIGYYNGEEDEEDDRTWTWRKLLNSVLGPQTGNKGGPVRAPDSYNLYDSKPDFKNDYGWSLAIDKHAYEPLTESNIGVYIVRLIAGAMMAPHVNPTAREVGVVLEGELVVEVVFPNGTAAMKAELAEGEVFWIPRYFPFCHVASRSGPAEFFGFTTSAKRNWPQFLAGARSVPRSLKGPQLAAGFGLSEERVEEIVESQENEIILPPWPEVGEVRMGG